MELTVKKKKKYTYEDYCRLTPPDSSCELINGDIVMEPAPYINHQLISRKIGFEINKFVTENALGEILFAPCDVFVDDYITVQPDIMFISKNRLAIIEKKYIKGAPDLVVEIISYGYGNIHRDTITKREIYAKFGVKEYWIVFPEEELVEILVLNKSGSYEAFETYKKSDTLESAVILPGLKIILTGIFE